jgi:hypothetical protein
VLDPRAVAEQRAAGALRRRVDGEHGDRAPTTPPLPQQRGEQRRLAAPGGPVTPSTWPRAVAGGRDERPPARSRAVRVSSRLSAAGAAARSPARRRAPSSAPVTPQPQRHCARPRARRCLA